MLVVAAHGLLPLVKRAVLKPRRVRAERRLQICERDCVLVAPRHPRPVLKLRITKEIEDGVPQREGCVLPRSRVANLRLKRVQQRMEEALVVAGHVVQCSAMLGSESSKGLRSSSTCALGVGGRTRGRACASFPSGMLSHVSRCLSCASSRRGEWRPPRPLLPFRRWGARAKTWRHRLGGGGGGGGVGYQYGCGAESLAVYTAAAVARSSMHYGGPTALNMDASL